MGKPTIRIADRTLTAGHSARVSGRAPQALGRTVVLEHRAARTATWTPLASAIVGRGDRYRFTVRVPRSGALRVVVQPEQTAAVAATLPTASRSASVRIARAVRVRSKRMHVRAGRRTAVVGRVAPRTAGLRVKLQVRRRGHWSTLDRARTRAGGRYRLRDRVRSTLSAPARVVTASAGGFALGKRRLGRLNIYRWANASWYGPGLYGGTMACGGTLTPGTLGVAHKSLPCGTRLTLRRGSRTVRVRVVDRGPYVGGREFDLTAATAQRLGFTGHGPVLVTR